MRLGMLGCGTIGSIVADAVLAGELNGVEIVAIASLAPMPPQADKLHAKWSTDPQELIGSEADVVLEAASQAVARQHAVDVIRSGKHLILMSVGALAEPAFRSALVTEANTRGREVVIPSGAIGALDVLRAARQRGALSKVTLTTTKHPRGLVGAPYLADKKFDLLKIKTRRVLFDGPASQAVPAFPKNVNVAASVSLAGLGFDQTRVRVVADPKARLTRHTLEAQGTFGKLFLEIEAQPHPDNPKTSYLACLAAIAAVAQFGSALKVGG